MFDTLSFAEIDGQHAELLPALTLMQAGGLADICRDLFEGSRFTVNPGVIGSVTDGLDLDTLDCFSSRGGGSA